MARPKKATLIDETQMNASSARTAPVSTSASTELVDALANAINQASGKTANRDDPKYYRDNGEYTYYVQNISNAHVLIDDIDIHRPKGQQYVYSGGGENLLEWTNNPDHVKNSTSLRIALRTKILVRLTPEEWDEKEQDFDNVKKSHDLIHMEMSRVAFQARSTPAKTASEIWKERREQDVLYPRRQTIISLTNRLKNSKVSDDEIMARIMKEHNRRPINVHEQILLRDSLNELAYPKSRKYVMELKAIVLTAQELAELKVKNENFERAMNPPTSITI